MIGRVVAYLLLLTAFFVIFAYFDAPLFYVPIASLQAYALVAVAVPAVRRARSTLWCKYVGTIIAALVSLLWCLSITTVIRTPVGPRHAWGVGGGSLRDMHGVGMDGRPLTWHVAWYWSGLTAGREGMWSGSWITPARSAYVQSWPVWPLMVATVVPAVILWVTNGRRYPPHACQHCGYDLTGNVSGRCPECGTVVAGSASRERPRRIS